MPKPVMLDAVHLDAARFASKDDSRYGITAVKIESDGRVIATNGHVLVNVPPSRMLSEDFPSVEGAASAMPEAGALVPADALKAARKVLPRKSSIPILRSCHAGTNGNGSAILTTTDLECASVSPAKIPDARFPDYQSVTPEERPDDVVVTLNPEYLREIADYAAKHELRTGGLEIRLSQKAPGENAVRMSFEREDGERVTIVLMPMRGRSE